MCPVCDKYFCFFCFSTSLVLKICNFLRYSNCGLLFVWLLLFFWGVGWGRGFFSSFFFLFFLISRVLLPVKCSPQEWLPLFLLGVCVCFFNHSCVNYVLVMQVKHKANAIHLLTCSKSWKMIWPSLAFWSLQCLVWVCLGGKYSVHDVGTNVRKTDSQAHD